MGVLRRISDIISANLNDLTEQFEDPETMLRQVIREMEEKIGESTQETAKVMANEKTLSRELDRNRQQADEWQKRAAKAVQSGDDDLARRALSRKREHEKLVAALEDQWNTAQETSKTLRRQLEAMKAKLAEAKREYGTLVARKRAADLRKRTESAVGGAAADIDRDAFSKFERLRARVEQSEAEADALAELRRDASTAEPCLPRSDEDVEVDAALAELKKQLNS